MEDLLTQAEAAIDDPSDTELMEVMADTREVLEWSKQRHWTFAWWIIICVAIMGCYYFYQAGSEQDYVAKRQALTDEQVQTEDVYKRQLINNGTKHNQHLISAGNTDNLFHFRRERS